MKAIRPLAEDRDTVLLRRADYEALMREAEDGADAAQIREAEARVDMLARNAAGDGELQPFRLVGSDGELR